MPPPYWGKLRCPEREGQAFHLVFLSYLLFLLLLYEHPDLSILWLRMCFCYHSLSYKLAPFLNELIPLRKGGIRGLCFSRGYFTTPKPPLLRGIFISTIS